MMDKKKTTMNRKQVIKSVAKSKIPVFIMVLAAFAVIVLVCLFGSMEKRKKGQEDLLVKEEAQVVDEQRIADIINYLKEIDNTILSSAEHLAEVGLVQTETERILMEFSESLDGLEKDILYVENLINEQMERQTEQRDEFLLSIAALSESQQETQSQIIAISTSISSVLSDFHEENQKEFKHVSESIKGLQETMSETEEKVKGYYDSLESLILLLQEENNEGHEELLDGLLTTKKDILTFLDGWSSNIELHIEKAFADLIKKMVALHEEITSAGTDIVALLELMEDGDMQRQEEIKGAFASIGLSLEQIKADYTEAYMEISSLIQKLEEENATNHEETLSVLKMMENNMKENSMESLTQVTKSLQDMQTNFLASIDNIKHEVSENLSSLGNEITGSISEYNINTTNRFDQLDNSMANISGIGIDINELAKNISTYNSNMTDMLRQMNVDITNQYKDLSNTVNRYDAGTQEGIDNLMKSLEQKLQQVFQFVSSGKRNIASALLTKGISIEEDATFSEICNGILAIPQELRIGVQEIPGIITYDYHYHTEGCYTLPVYHVHTGNSANGGGCYTIPITHSHTDSCYTVTQIVRKVTAKWFTGEGTGHACCASGYGQNWAKYMYVEETYVNGALVSSVSGGGDLGYCCGICFERRAAECGYTREYTDLNCGYSDGINGYDVGCGKNEQTVEEYIPGCGLSDRQIIGAHIVYDRNALHMATSISMEETYEIPSSDLKEKWTVSGNIPEIKRTEDVGKEAE